MLELSADVLQSLFLLDAEGGTLRWKSRPQSQFKNKQAWSAWNSRYSGEVAGSARPDGYVSVRIQGRRYRLHRLIYAIFHSLAMSEVPPEIDHEDTDQTNNRPCNLRPATHAQNLWNTRGHKDSKSGFKGVSWESRYKHWEARIRCGSKRIHLGYFKTPEMAHAAYAAAANDLHGDFARAA